MISEPFTPRKSLDSAFPSCDKPNTLLIEKKFVEQFTPNYKNTTFILQFQNNLCSQLCNIFMFFFVQRCLEINNHIFCWWLYE